jgi:membrane protein YdbS with pleckstrin-like domain
MEVLMGKQYILNGTAFLASIVAIVWSRIYTGGSLEWVTFGLAAAIAVAGVAGLKVAQTRRNEVAFGVLGLIGAWTAVAALVFAGATLGWLAFAGGVAVALVAAGGLIVHELTTERVVHTLEVREQDAELRTAA